MSSLLFLLFRLESSGALSPLRPFSVLHPRTLVPDFLQWIILPVSTVLFPFQIFPVLSSPVLQYHSSPDQDTFQGPTRPRHRLLAKHMPTPLSLIQGNRNGKQRPYNPPDTDSFRSTWKWSWNMRRWTRHTLSNLMPPTRPSDGSRLIFSSLHCTPQTFQVIWTLQDLHHIAMHILSRRKYRFFLYFSAQSVAMLDSFICSTPFRFIICQLDNIRSEMQA